MKRLSPKGVGEDANRMKGKIGRNKEGSENDDHTGDNQNLTKFYRAHFVWIIFLQ